VTGWQSDSGLWEAGGMKKPELTDAGWLGPRDEMDRASHRFGKRSECHEIICVEKAVTDGPSTQPETNELLYRAFRRYVKLKHAAFGVSSDFLPPLYRAQRKITSERNSIYVENDCHRVHDLLLCVWASSRP
jgi:hypothetical protein